MLIQDWSSVTKSFWESNPKALAVKEFRDYYDIDTSKDKAVSSRIMWGIAFLVDYESPYFGMVESERYKIVQPSYFHDCAPPKNIVEHYRLIQKDSEKRLIEAWNKKADELVDFMESTPLDLENATQIVKIMQSIKDILILKDEIDKRVAKADTKSKNRAGGESSLLEKDSI